MRDDERFTPADQLPAGFYAEVEVLVGAVEAVEGFTVPWVAGRSKDGKRFYPDRDLPKDVAGVDTRRSVAFHEIGEWLRMNAGETYDKDSDPPGAAHYDANGVEKIEVERQGGDWHSYCRAMRPVLKQVDDEGLTNLPPLQDWDLRPYEDDDVDLLDRIDAAKSTLSQPSSPTSGLQNYDLEGARARRKKRRKPSDQEKPMPIAATAGEALKLFIPITKVDAAKRLVYGIATAELPDLSGEVCDYATTKPLYEKWSGEFAKNTDGKSVGNLRAMHGNVAAGKLTAISFNDDAKKIEICAKVVDDGEWHKVEEGVYTGFSQGGKYVKRWKDGDMTRYTADPAEVSLVDSPCLKEATFEIVKADGSSEQRRFKEKVFSADDIISFAADWKDGAEVPAAFARGIFNLQKILKAGDPLFAIVKDVTEADKIELLIGKIAKLADDDDVQRVYVHKQLPGKYFRRKAELDQALVDLAAADAARKSAAPVLDAIAGIKELLVKQVGGDAGLAKPATTETKPAGDGGAVAKKDYSDDERKAMAKDGRAMKDGSYPIDNKADLEDAIQAFGRAKNKTATKRHITKRAKALKATDMLPADWPGSTKDKDSKKVAGDGGLTKGADLWSISDLLLLLDGVSRMEDNAELPSWSFGNSVDLPKDLCDRFGAALVELGDIAAEMLDVVLNSMKEEEANEAVANAAVASDLGKLAGLRLLVKVGAKHSAADKERIAKAHDLLTELDPDCCPAGDGGEDAEKLAKALARTLDAEREANAKLLNETILPEIGKLADAIGKIGVTVQNIADQPLPMGTSSVRVVEKTHDYGALADAIRSGTAGEDDLTRLANAIQSRMQRGIVPTGK